MSHITKNKEPPPPPGNVGLFEILPVLDSGLQSTPPPPTHPPTYSGDHAAPIVYRLVLKMKLKSGGQSFKIDRTGTHSSHTNLHSTQPHPKVTLKMTPSQERD